MELINLPLRESSHLTRQDDLPPQVSSSSLDSQSGPSPSSQLTLDNLPIGILRCIFEYLHTAQSLGRLARTSKSLKQIVEHHGWNVFVRQHFGTGGWPPGSWKTLARRLTWQARAWDRRAFILSSIVSPSKLACQEPRDGRRRRPRHGRRSQHAAGRSQTFPPSILVDATAQINGVSESELLVLGAGQDVVVRWRELLCSAPQKETWATLVGEAAGFKAGRDDVSAIALLKDLDTAAAQMMLVGRASGNVQLLSTRFEDAGRVIGRLQPDIARIGTRSVQTEVQHIDVDMAENSAAIATKNTLLFYPLAAEFPKSATNLEPEENGSPLETVIRPTETVNMKSLDDSTSFGRIYQVRHMANGHVALALGSTTEPLRCLVRTPSGTVATDTAKMRASNRCLDSYTLYKSQTQTQTSRCILPLDTSSVAGGSACTILSSHDDGTIRLRDLRTPSAIDTIYQDHFELIPPIGPLLADGTHRFLAGSARAALIKMFDYRWPKASYYYTDAVPCSATPPRPTPRPLVWTLPPPPAADARRARCCHGGAGIGQMCTLHALMRTDYYRPNCNVYLPYIGSGSGLDVSPVYTLARASSASSTVYAGLSGELMTMRLRGRSSAAAADDDEDDDDEDAEARFMRKGPGRTALPDGYTYHEAVASLVETGDGIALRDISDSLRLPTVWTQKRRRRRQQQQRQRLESWGQVDQEGFCRLDEMFM